MKLRATCKRTGNGSFVSQFFAQWFFYPAAGSENKTNTNQTNKKTTGNCSAHPLHVEGQKLTGV